MINFRSVIEQAAKRQIDERESHYDFKMPPADKAFLIWMIADYTFNTIEKFVKGSMEHNPTADPDSSFMVQCNHMMELEKELCDLLPYFYAHKLKLAQHGNHKTKSSKP